MRQNPSPPRLRWQWAKNRSHYCLPLILHLRSEVHYSHKYRRNSKNAIFIHSLRCLYSDIYIHVRNFGRYAHEFYFLFFSRIIYNMSGKSLYVLLSLYLDKYVQSFFSLSKLKSKLLLLIQ